MFANREALVAQREGRDALNREVIGSNPIHAGGTDATSGISPPADPKGPPLYYFEISVFGDDP